MDKDQELAALRAKLKKREGTPGFEENAREIKKRIDELSA